MNAITDKIHKIHLIGHFCTMFYQPGLMTIKACTLRGTKTNLMRTLLDCESLGITPPVIQP